MTRPLKVSGTFPPHHYELLNEIHAQRAGRDVVAAHTFTKAELDAISYDVGDVSHTLPSGTIFHPIWDRAAQPRLIEATLAAMAALYPYIQE